MHPVAGARRPVHDRAVSANEPLRLSLEIDRRSEQISGRLYDDAGVATPFGGWLGLLEGLRKATVLEETPAADGGPTADAAGWAIADSGAEGKR